MIMHSASPRSPLRDSDEWRAIHQPWALKDSDAKLAAYKALVDCDFQGLLLQARGTREFMMQGPEYGQLLADLTTDPLALDRAVMSGMGYGVHAAGVLSRDLVRRMELPKEKPEVPPQSAQEAKLYATKLFKAGKYGAAADMYSMSIKLLSDFRRIVLVDIRVTGVGVELTLRALARTEQKIHDELIAPALHANLAACRIRQHRWEEAIEACDRALHLSPECTSIAPKPCPHWLCVGRKRRDCNTLWTVATVPVCAQTPRLSSAVRPRSEP